VKCSKPNGEEIEKETGRPPVDRGNFVDCNSVDKENHHGIMAIVHNLPLDSFGLQVLRILSLPLPPGDDNLEIKWSNEEKTKSEQVR
jgi:hypothetical protein